MSDQKYHMTDDEFIDYCYKTLLCRNAEKEGKDSYLSFLKNGVSREHVLISFLESEEYQTRTASSEFFAPGHFSSAIPSHKDRKRFLEEKPYKFSAPGIDLNEKEQLDLLDAFLPFYKEIPFSAKKVPPNRYYFDNPAYSYGDGIMLYCMLRLFKPKRIIEVGSGYSSCLMMDVNEASFDGKIDLTFIEPYPDILHSLLNEEDKKKINIKPLKFQDVEQNIFKRLEQNDMLIIDSSHVSKLGSDVNHLFFEVLPLLKEGVLVHIHDIFWPFEYPLDWIREGRAWNEAYLVRAFLQYNVKFKILLFSSYLFWKHPEWFKDKMPFFAENPGGKIWLQKRYN